MELGHGVIVKLLLLNLKQQLTVQVLCEEFQRQASPDPVNYVQQQKKDEKNIDESSTPPFTQS